MPALFQPVPPEMLREQLAAYADFLAARDGVIDEARRTLSRREEQTERMERSARTFDASFDRELFDAQYRGYDAARETPESMRVLLCFLKINANEAYAVERVLAKPRASDDLVAGLERTVLIEERYHTRLLVSAGALFGVRVVDAAEPEFVTRAIVAGIAEMPDAMARPITLAGEVVGIVTFMRAIAAVRRVFRDSPVTRDALEERVTEVLIDEVGHLSLNRLLARRGTFTALRAVLPGVALGTHGALPEAASLGILPVPIREAWNLDVRTLPDEIRRRAFIA